MHVRGFRAATSESACPFRIFVSRAAGAVRAPTKTNSRPLGHPTGNAVRARHLPVRPPAAAAVRRSRAGMGSVDALHADLLRLVFANLDAPCLALAGCVCRAWRDTAMDDALWMERCRERLPALASREGAVRLYRWLDQQEAEVRSAPRRAHPPLPPLMRLHEARVLLVQRANMRDGLDDARRGREQASRRAARISADLATAEL